MAVTTKQATTTDNIKTTADARMIQTKPFNQNRINRNTAYQTRMNHTIGSLCNSHFDYEIIYCKSIIH